MNSPINVVSREPEQVDHYRSVRGRMAALAVGLSAEDMAAQSMPDASPGKWHLGHASWFFEAMLLERDPDYRPVDPRWRRVFNSYYEALGQRVDRAQRGLMTRPSLDEVLAYRREVDCRVLRRLGEGPLDDQAAYLLVLGLQHEEQHQELFLTDILSLMASSPLSPAAYEIDPTARPSHAPLGSWTHHPGGIVEMGAADGFAFDNEQPRHRCLLAPFAMADDLVTQAEWAAFIADGGYRRPELWLSDGWAWVQAEGVQAPLYWREVDGQAMAFTLAGLTSRDPHAPVRHISYYEADAYVRWAGCRLPTEFEWEAVAQAESASARDLFDRVWQWTASAYAPYPGFRPTEGAASEYNGKFMANQMVCRGGSAATAPGHSRASYRNFFYPHQRWQFLGLRLARDEPRKAGGRPVIAAAHSTTPNAFAEALMRALEGPDRSLSPKWLYDAEGSRLFEAITDLPEYYPTRQEAALLRRIAPRLAEAMGDDAVLVEFGSGASEKTRILLDAAPGVSTYVPIDISPAALADAAAGIQAAYPGLTVRPLMGDFLSIRDLPPDLGSGRRVGFFPGSTIGNLSPDEAARFLTNARQMLGQGALFILGVDLVKAPETLIAAYDDAAGVSAAFNKNLLARANRELGADFDLAAFDHVAVWDADAARMEMRLVSRRDQVVHLAGRAFPLKAGDSLHTENAHKFTRNTLSDLVHPAGWSIVEVFESPAPSVALALLEA